jgi:hypothetical protein
MYACHERGVHTAYMPRTRGMYTRLLCGMHATCTQYMRGMHAASMRRPRRRRTRARKQPRVSSRKTRSSRRRRVHAACMRCTCRVLAACFPRVHVGVCVCARVCVFVRVSESEPVCACGSVRVCACVRLRVRDCAHEYVTRCRLHFARCRLHVASSRWHVARCQTHAVMLVRSCRMRSTSLQRPCTGPEGLHTGPCRPHRRTGTRQHPYRDSPASAPGLTRPGSSIWHGSDMISRAGRRQRPWPYALEVFHWRPSYRSFRPRLVRVGCCGAILCESWARFCLTTPFFSQALLPSRH